MGVLRGKRTARRGNRKNCGVIAARRYYGVLLMQVQNRLHFFHCAFSKLRIGVQQKQISPFPPEFACSPVASADESLVFRAANILHRNSGSRHGSAHCRYALVRSRIIQNKDQRIRRRKPLQAFQAQLQLVSRTVARNYNRNGTNVRNGDGFSQNSFLVFAPA